jgi:hypothetical protein
MSRKRIAQDRHSSTSDSVLVDIRSRTESDFDHPKEAGERLADKHGKMFDDVLRKYLSKKKMREVKKKPA